jgi:hypothetical protein
MEKLVSMRGTPDVVELPLGIVKISKDAVSWLRGLNGELEMASRLQVLGDDWTVLHSIPIGDRGSDIDHIVVGPTGVFAINAKRLIDAKVWVSGARLLVDGRKREYLRNADYESTRVEHVLRAAGIPLPVLPVVAICGAKSVRIRSNPAWNGRNIGVAKAASVVKRMLRRPAKLSPSQVARVAAVFSDSKAWTRKPVTGGPTPEVLAAFAHIERGVTRWNAAIGSIGFAILLAMLIAAMGTMSILTHVG